MSQERNQRFDRVRLYVVKVKCEERVDTLTEDRIGEFRVCPFQMDSQILCSKAESYVFGDKKDRISTGNSASLR